MNNLNPYPYNFDIVLTHISSIHAGSIVEHEGKHITVCEKDINVDSFMGNSLFGDSYLLGNKPVKKIIIKTPKNNH